MERLLVVNADDFGLSDGVNEGIIDAHVKGVVTSTSLMVRRPAASAAAALAAANPTLCVGLHVDMGEWIFQDGEWVTADDIVDLEDADAVSLELEAQVQAFSSMVGRPPSHLDSHQHIHRSEPASSLVDTVGERLGVPVRDRRVRYIGDFYGQTGKGEPLPDAIGVSALISLIDRLPPGISEIGCHPGYADDVDTTYATERAIEVRTLCDPAVRVALVRANVELRSFCDLS